MAKQASRPLSPSLALERTAKALVTWERTNGRRVPWRASGPVYPLAVAEILLQKTKSRDALVVWREVTEKYATERELAEAEPQTLQLMVRRLGLGSQRVQRLQQMARSLARGVPLDQLSGVGPYGRSILALASGMEPREAPVDGNIARVVCRLVGLAFERGEPRKKAETRAAVRRLMSTRRDARGQLEVVYALVDLGALICTPRNPAHASCPVARWCAFAATDPATPLLSPGTCGSATRAP